MGQDDVQGHDRLHPERTWYIKEEQIESNLSWFVGISVDFMELNLKDLTKIKIKCILISTFEKRKKKEHKSHALLSSVISFVIQARKISFKNQVP